jgi:hypothetical protein
MKNRIYFLVIFLSISVFAQHKTLELTNIQTGKVIFFEENQCVKIRTLDHKKWIGNLKITDSLSIIVNNHKVEIDSLQSIKNQPKILGTLRTIFLITGLSIVGASIIAASGGSDAAFLLFTVGSGTTISSGIIEGLNSNYTKRKWTYKIVEK